MAHAEVQSSSTEGQDSLNWKLRPAGCPTSRVFEKWGLSLVQLPSAADWPVAIAGDINEKGEIVGDVLNLAFDQGYSSLWQPTDPQRRTYKLTLLPNPWGHPNGDTAEGINNSGDIVGASWDDNGNFVAVRWTTKDPSSVRLLGFPGDWSLAFRVNEYGIATGTYGTYSVGQCANECVAAVQFH
jgi:probable HAF family extracellular repeat protein